MKLARTMHFEDKQDSGPFQKYSVNVQYAKRANKIAISPIMPFEQRTYFM
jgi:hypothetical protein